MNTSNFMIAFDVIIAVLGAYIVVRSMIMKSKHIIPTLFVASEEIKNCKDVPGFVNFLFPKALVFGLICLVFGIIDFTIDANIFISAPKWLNIVLLVLFLIVWFWFSFSIKKGKEKYFKVTAL